MYILVLFLFACSIQNIKAQEKEEEIFTVVEEMPKFSECEALKGEEANTCTTSGIMTFIVENFTYPSVAIEKGLQGKVYVRFVVDTKGKVTDVNVARGVDEILDTAAINLVSKLPNFTPGKIDGISVPVQYLIPISFSLE